MDENINKDVLTFDVSHLFAKSSGATDKYSFDGPAELKELKLLSNVKGELEIMRINSGVSAGNEDEDEENLDGFNVEIKNAETEVELECERCLKKFKKKIKIKLADRKFLMKKPRTVKDPNDIFLVDRKKQELDISEMLRQEIILHFPLISVCLNGCKGICPVCAKDKNTGNCNCKTETEDSNRGHKPLAILKQLLK